MIHADKEDAARYCVFLFLLALVTAIGSALYLWSKP